MHGSKTPRGPAAATFKSGKYSKFLPSRLFARYREAQDDPELLSLRSELALLDARLADLLSRVDTGESGALWRQAKQAHAAFQAAKLSGHVEKMQAALAELETAIDRAVEDYQAWDEVVSLIAQRRRLAETEHKRLIKAGLMISVEEAMGLVAQLVDVITQNISDRAVLGKIVAGLETLGHRNGHGQTWDDEDAARR